MATPPDIQVLDSDEDHTKQIHFAGDLRTVILDVAAFQKKMNSLSFITYSDESSAPSKAKLVRGENGLDGNVEFLTLVHGKSFVRKQIETILNGVISENKLKFKSGEKVQWLLCMQRRWLNMQRIVSQAAKRQKKTDWLQILPLHAVKIQEPHEKNQDSETMMDETDNENEDEDEDEDEGEEEEGENDDKEKDDGEKEVRSKPAACTPDTSFADTQVDELQNDTCAQPVGYHLHLLRAAGSAERVTQPASDSQALANANADAYDVKFSTELMIPMRRHTTRNNAPWEPGMLHLAGLSDSDYALARWPDGYKAALPDKVEYIKGLSRAGGSTNSDEPRTWTHIVTNHTIYVKQRIDRHLLVSIYEQNKQILQIRTDTFGNIADQKTALPPDNDVLKEAIAFMSEIAADFADDKIEKCNLPEERKKRLAIRRSGTAQNPVEKKERQRQRQRVLPKGRRRRNQRQALLIQNRRRQLLDAIQL